MSGGAEQALHGRMGIGFQRLLAGHQIHMAGLQILQVRMDALQTRQELTQAKATQCVVAWEFGDVQGHGVALVVWRRTADWDAGTLKNGSNFTPPSPTSGPRAEIISDHEHHIQRSVGN